MAECGCIGGNTGIWDCPEVEVDCNGDAGGWAYLAECGCIGGNTGIYECPQEVDCNGDPGGTAYWADCGCIGGNTGITECCSPCPEQTSSISSIKPGKGMGMSTMSSFGGVECVCQKDPCQKFNTWIEEHNNGGGIYYKDNLISNGYGTCSNGTLGCPPDNLPYNVNNNQTFYYYNGWKPYEDCGIHCLPVEFSYTYGELSAYMGERNNPNSTGGQPDPNLDKQNWCTLFILDALTNDSKGTPCDFANYAYGSQECTQDQTISVTNTLPTLYDHFGITATRVPDNQPINTVCDLLSRLNGNGKGLVNSFEENGARHSNLIYGIKRNKSGEFKIDVFDTSKEERNQPNRPFTYFHTGGIDYVVTKK